MFQFLLGGSKSRQSRTTDRRRRLTRSLLKPEQLEERRVLTLLGIEPLLANPIIDYDNGGNASYDASSGLFNIDAAPLNWTEDTGAGFFLGGTFDVNILVDSGGNLVGGVASDDLVVTGDLDLNFDFVPDFSGTLLTGEILAFGFENQGALDDFDFRFVPTGGALLSFYASGDLGVTLELENSTFNDDFSVNFGGSPAKGRLGAVESTANPDIDIEKSTNGEDADTGTGPALLVDDTATFEYVVTNTGDVPLANVSVTDDQGVSVAFQGGDSNNDGLLGTDETWIYTGSSVVVAGQYTNIGSVTGVDSTGQVAEPVGDSDPSNHFGVDADIEIKKFVDQTVISETMVHLDFEGLAPGTIVDSQFPGVTISATNRRDGGLGNAAMIFDSSAPTGGDYDLGAPNVDFGGPGVGSGGGTYSDAQNTQELGNILIITEDGDGSDPDDEAQGGVFTFTFDHPVRVDYLELLDIDSNESGGSVLTINSSSGSQSFSIPALGNNSFQRLDINVDDVTSVEVDFVSSGAITELKWTEFTEEKVWYDANDPPGPSFELGDDIEFTYKVSNPSALPIASVTLVDDNATPSDNSDDFTPIFVQGDDNNDNKLDPGEIWEYTFTISAGSIGQFENLATAQGNPDGFPDLDVSDNDPANYTVVGLPGIDIEKFTNSIDADDPNGTDVPQVAVGDTVTWTYEVTNTGDVPFPESDVSVVDDAGTPGDTSDDFIPALEPTSDLGSDGLLSPGETWIYSASAPAVALSEASGEVTSISLAGSGSFDGANGNIRSFSKDGVSVNASAFSRDSSGSWDEVFLGAFSGGLGVTDNSEGDGSGGTHRIDNVGEQNYVLFEFSEPVVVDRLFLSSVKKDSDITVWFGTVSDAFTQHVNLNDTVLAALTTETNNTRSSKSRWADINDGQVIGNVLVVAASVSDSTPEDRFKVKKVKFEKTDSAVYGNVGSVFTAAGPSDSDPSHYRNPTPVSSGKIGDFVWNDANMNGRQDSGEAGIANVEVQLLDSSGSVIGTTTTDSDGMYVFEGLASGDYRVKFIAPANFVFSPQYQGDDAYNGSNADPHSGITDVVSLHPHEVDNSIDAGLYESAVDTYFEAESGALEQPWQVFSSSSASGGEFIQAPNGTGSHHNHVVNGKSVHYDFSVSQAGTYEISGLVKARNSRDNSVWVRVNNGPWVQWHMDKNKSFEWQDVTDGWDQDKVTFDLSAGVNHMEIKVREDGTKIDKFMVSRVQHSAILISAFDYVSGAGGDWVVDTDEDGNEFLVAGGGDHYRAPEAGDILIYQFDVATADTYYLFAHVSAANGAENSFWVRVDGGEWVEWHLAPTGEGNWQWQRVTAGGDREVVTFELSEGIHTLEVSVRESGTSVDWWTFSTDEDYPG